MTYRSDPATETANRQAVENLRTFYDNCCAADWSYNYAESFAVLNAGREQIMRLRARADESPAMMEIFKAFLAYDCRTGSRPVRP